MSTKETLRTKIQQQQCKCSTTSNESRGKHTTKTPQIFLLLLLNYIVVYNFLQRPLIWSLYMDYC